jgi:hypothetical protein
VCVRSRKRERERERLRERKGGRERERERDSERDSERGREGERGRKRERERGRVYHDDGGTSLFPYHLPEVSACVRERCLSCHIPARGKEEQERGKRK